MRFFDETLIYPIRTYHRNCISHYLKKKKDIFSSLSYLLTGQCGRRKNATLQVWNIGEIWLNIVYRVHDVEENSSNFIRFILPLQNYYLDKWYRFTNPIIQYCEDYIWSQNTVSSKCAPFFYYAGLKNLISLDLTLLMTVAENIV